MSLKTISLYSKPTGCQQCIAMKRSLNKTGVEYHVIDATTDEARELLAGLGFMQAPVTLVHDADGNLIDSFSGFRPDKIEAFTEDPLVPRVTKDTALSNA
ncbi:glutaredoxin domain-containing protein [Arthrobacter caoxuetaonis]|uniref:Glutaredoxin domain-containing protein n=1 Tax=Arthrobacter caoxuetaonis TaxID=2886935 RepID=A0A9X1SGK4_9MICC|nr:glutaredoxin domain-containing protein [Arthrobacter caoxuetaonis]MCC3299459.1 hypothetical protein [Arthrobacter caoxuetaonis]USQ59049.1 hypothetical protein NF551_18255 [Arthrobacter caoxuetaonis]